MKTLHQRYKRYAVASVIWVSAIVVTTVGSAVPQAFAAGTVSATAPSAAAGNDAVRLAYASWKNSYVTTSGAGGNLRVQRSKEDNYDTVSEGIGYGMLFSAYLSDRSTFDKLWAYEQAHLDSKGLMNWRIGAGGNTTGYNGATDSDEDIATALVVANQRWGGYQSAATQQINKILAYEVEPGTNYLKPGDEWGGSDILNPSYFAPSYYKLYQSVTGNTRWNDVYNANYQVLAALDQRTASGTTGLAPDWTNAYGYQTNGMSFNYGYDAVRLPIRMAISALWNGDATATARIKKVDTFFSAKSPHSIVDGYTLGGSPTSSYHSPAFVGAAASAAIASPDSAHRATTWNELVAATGTGYYHESIRLLSMMVASGVMVDPESITDSTTAVPAGPAVSTSQVTPALTALTNSSVDVWWPSNGARVIGTQPFKAMVPNRAIESYQMFWQVDGGTFNPMVNSYEDYPHKQTDVDVSKWNWQPTGQYRVTFVAKSSTGSTLASKSVVITTR